MVFLLTQFAFALPTPCHSMQLEPWDSPLNPVNYPEHKSPSKAQRDVYNLPNIALSDNFALHWGDDLSLSAQKQDAILDHLELSWTHEIEDMQYPAPYGSEQYLFNVYMGSSGSGAPSDAGVAGYYTTDEEGWPMVVLGEYIAEYDDQYSAIPHEFFHAVQHSTESYPYSGASAWYWEATATWIENQVLPDDPNYSVFLFGYAFLPHHSLLFFDYFDTGAIEEYHQYGAFIFPQFLSEYYDGADWIRDSWVDAAGYSDPFSYLLERFEAEGQDPNVIFAEFAANNAYWDYAHQSWYTYYLDYYASYFNGSDHRITDNINANGTGDWVSSSSEYPLEYAGYHHIRLQESINDLLYFSFEGDSIGSQGSEAVWSVTAIRRVGDSASYEWLGTFNAFDSVPLAMLATSDELVLSITVLADRYIEGERFEYQYKLVPTNADNDSEKMNPKGCGCQVADNNPLSTFWGLVLLCGITTVRRRSPHRLH